MKSDYLSHRRATSVSLLGLGIQLGLALILAIYAAYSGGDHAATTAAIFVGIGVVVWFALAVLFDQHRRERIEAMEAESLRASGAAAASAFEGTGDDLRVAARRLAAVQKFFIPGVSLFVGLLLVVLGYVRFREGAALIDPDRFVASELPGWAIAIGLGVGFVGFVFARFVSGMATQKVWIPLRAGAAYAVGSALFGLSIAVGHFVEMAAGPDAVLRYLQAAIPVVMMLLGVEVFLNFVLDIYRPRRAGEVARPAFDSRVLGFLAAPDRIAESVGEAISYQFGVDVTGTWFYQLMSRSLAMLVVIALVLGWLMTSFVVVQPHQRAMVLTFGQISRPDVGPGLHLKLPFPISRVEIPEHEVTRPDGTTAVVRTATGVRVIHLGAAPPDSDDAAILWGEEHAVDEILNIVQSSLEVDRRREDGRARTDLALVAVEVPVHYVVRDLELYDSFAAPGYRQQLLKSIGERVVTRFLSHLNIDEVLAGRRTDLSSELRAELEEAYGRLNRDRGAGIEIMFVGAAGVHPPKDVARAFENVVKAQQTYQAALEEAERERTEILAGVAGSVERAREIVEQIDRLDEMGRAGSPAEDLVEQRLAVQRLLEDAGGAAGDLLLAAGAERWRRHMSERGRAALFEGQVASYKAAPALYRSRLYFGAMQSAMRDARVYIAPGSIPGMHVRMELQDRETGRDVFDPEGQMDDR